MIVVVAVDNEYWRDVEEDGIEYPEEELYSEVELPGFLFFEVTSEEVDTIVLVKTVLNN